MSTEVSNNNDFGIFDYFTNGFSILLKEEKREINWEEIEQLEAYKLDLLTTDEVCLNIVLKDNIITISEGTNGWEYFLKKLDEQFPLLEKDWDWKITQPPFATNHTILFSK